MARRAGWWLLGWVVLLAAAGLGTRVAAGEPVLVAQQAPAPSIAQAPAPAPQARLISLDFKDADINNVLRILAEFSGLNIVSGEDVKGRVTVKLQNVPWQQALDAVVRAVKLAYVQEGNIIRVDRLENLSKEAEAQFRAEQREVEIQQRREQARIELAERQAARRAAEERAAFELEEAKRKAELERRKAEFELEEARRKAELEREKAAFELAEARRKAELEAEKARREEEFQKKPLVEEIITLKYAHVGKKRVSKIDFFTDVVTTEERPGIEEAIRRPTGRPGEERGLLSPRGELTVDARTNSLIVRDIPENLAKIKEFIAKVDRPTPAILIEARIVEISRRDARSLGIVWGGAFNPRTGQDSPIVDVRGAAPGGTGGTAVNLPAPAPTIGFGASPFGLAIGWLASNFALDLQLQALEGEGRARVLSSPSIVTLDNEPATLASGRKEPIISVIVVQGAQQAAITFQDVTTRIQVTPRVIPGENKLSLGIAVKRESVIDRVTTVSLNAPIVSTRQAVTQAEIPDGGTIVLGGLRDEEVRDTTQGVPWLKKIPVLGWLFKNELAEAQRNELVVFLTAKVVQSPGQTALGPREIVIAGDAGLLSPVGGGGTPPVPAAPAGGPAAATTPAPAAGVHGPTGRLSPSER